MAQKSWKVTWNKDLYNYEKLIKDFKNEKIINIFQSKGQAKMVNLPKIGDFVYISCNKLKIMKCKVKTNFVEYKKKKKDEYNKGEIRNHTDNKIYNILEILKVYDNPKVLKGCQRTWCTYKVKPS